MEKVLPLPSLSIPSPDLNAFCLDDLSFKTKLIEPTHFFLKMMMIDDFINSIHMKLIKLAWFAEQIKNLSKITPSVQFVIKSANRQVSPVFSRIFFIVLVEPLNGTGSVETKLLRSKFYFTNVLVISSHVENIGPVPPLPFTLHGHLHLCSVDIKCNRSDFSSVLHSLAQE